MIVPGDGSAQPQSPNHVNIVVKNSDLFAKAPSQAELSEAKNKTNQEET